MRTTKHDEDEDDEREIKVRTPAGESVEGSEPRCRADADEPAAEAASPGSRLANGLKAALGITNRRQQPQQQAPPPPPKTERQEVIEQLEAADQQPLDPETQYELPPLDLLLPNDDVCYEEHEKEVRRKAKILEKTFKNFGFNVQGRRDRDRARSSPSTRSSWKPACGCRRSPAWPTTWRSPCACRACGSSRRSPARTPSASRCPTSTASSCGSAR